MVIKKTIPVIKKTILAKNGYLYAAFCQKTFFQSHSLIETHDQKISLAQKKNYFTRQFYSNAFRHKRLLNE